MADVYMGRPFSKILIANRGEIAFRIMVTARKLGYATLAVYAWDDAEAPYVSLADEAVALPGIGARDTYLNADALLEAASRCGADAVHPGYGFLSESPAFARRCQELELVFVGPPADVMALMGDKCAARDYAQKMGLATIPGFHSPNQDMETLKAGALSLGLPVMIKAAAGGGGRGMRRVTDEAHLAEALASAQSEAQAAFGDGRLFIEKIIDAARHIEVQVFGDYHGNVVHLLERDCSMQRRHQKVIEEAPAPGLSGDTRKKMSEAAVALARAVNYVGAGTVEFLLDKEGGFYFLEMNTRLQVEHGVTELISGQDLVAWQLGVAAGQPLPLLQEQLQVKGHAMQARLYAEDPQAGFLPQVGTLQVWKVPEWDGLRIDAGYRSGNTIGSHYDPMVAKVLTWGEDRDSARRSLLRALEDTVFLGVTSNRRFLGDLLCDPKFVAAEMDTNLVDHLVSGEASMGKPPREAGFMAAALFHWFNTRDMPAMLRNWYSVGEPHFSYQLHEQVCGDHDFMVTPGEEGGFRVTSGSQTMHIKPHRLYAPHGEGWISLECNGVLYSLYVLYQEGLLWLKVSYWELCFSDKTLQVGVAKQVEDSSQLKAPMAGRVVALRCRVGDCVEAGQTLAVLEAMKMEHTLKAERAGEIAAVLVVSGQQVKGGQVLITWLGR